MSRAVSDEIARLDRELDECKQAYALLFKAEGALRARLDELLELLQEASEETRHPDYDWPLWLSRKVDAAISSRAQEKP